MHFPSVYPANCRTCVVILTLTTITLENTTLYHQMYNYYSREKSFIFLLQRLWNFYSFSTFIFRRDILWQKEMFCWRMSSILFLWYVTQLITGIFLIKNKLIILSCTPNSCSLHYLSFNVHSIFTKLCKSLNNR